MTDNGVLIARHGHCATYGCHLISSLVRNATRFGARPLPKNNNSPEWQALQAGREVGATVRFIDLPAWHAAFSRLENRYADVADAEHEARADAYELALADSLAVQGRDALWDHLFEDVGDTAGALDELAQRLSTYFTHLRDDDPGSLGNQARERMMARWIAWAVADAGGKADDLLVVCGGYHAPALARLWRTLPAALPDTPEPDAIDGGARTVPDAQAGTTCAPTTDSNTADVAARSVRYGSYLVPYTFRRLESIADARGLSSEELEDRLAPDLGLDAQGTMQLDFGPRAFQVGFDETLKPYVRERGADGVPGARLADLPKPKKTDDPVKGKEAVERQAAEEGCAHHRESAARATRGCDVLAPPLGTRRVSRVSR